MLMVELHLGLVHLQEAKWHIECASSIFRTDTD
jgi:hypothetical protein